jgi:ABC-type polar amino acid transport system ATPase subunit
MQSIISLINLNKTFGTQNVLKDINLDVEEGDILSIVGRSGSGKTTLLRCLNFLETFDSGSLTVDGTTIDRAEFPDKPKKKSLINPEYETNPFRAFSAQNEIISFYKKKIYAIRSKIGFLFQDFQLFNNLSVINNIIKPLMIVNKLEKEEAIIQARKQLEKFDMKSHMNHSPADLSGGQKQRVAIARALAMEPKIMLYDEPTSALDPELVKDVAEIIKLLNEEGMTQIIVTHDMTFLHTISSTVAYLQEGELIEKGTVHQIFHNAKDIRTRRYFNIFRERLA